MGTQMCRSCGNTHFFYNGTAKVCSLCGAVYPDDFDVEPQAVRVVSRYKFDGLFLAGCMLFLTAISVFLFSFFDIRLIGVSLALYLIALIPMAIFRVKSNAAGSNVYANWVLFLIAVNAALCLMRIMIV